MNYLDLDDSLKRVTDLQYGYEHCHSVKSWSGGPFSERQLLGKEHCWRA